MTERRPNEAKVPIEKIYEVIEHNPGINLTDLAREAGVARGTLEGRLATLESKGFYLVEDRYGGLYVHELFR